MRRRKPKGKLPVASGYRRALVRNLAKALIENGKIKTTRARSKYVIRLGDRLITLAKRQDLHARRQALQIINDPKLISKLFDELGPRFQGRQGGYTRITKIGYRRGDGAPMAQVEFVE